LLGCIVVFAWLALQEVLPRAEVLLDVSSVSVLGRPGFWLMSYLFDTVRLFFNFVDVLDGNLVCRLGLSRVLQLNRALLA